MAYKFTRASSTYISYPHLDFLDGATACSISCWVKAPEADANYDGIVSAMNQTSGGYGIALQIYSGGENSIQIGTAAYGTVSAYVKENCLSSSSWKHLFVCYDGNLASGSRVRAWLDGTEISSWTSTNAASLLGTNTDVLVFGAHRISGTTRYFDGELAEVALWDVAITDATTITDLAAGRLPTAQTTYTSNLQFYRTLRNDADEGYGTGASTVTGATVSSHPAAVDTTALTPTKASLTLTGRAPTFNVVGSREVAIGCGALALTTRAPGRWLYQGETGYLEARAGLARAGVTYAGFAQPTFRVYIDGVDRTSLFYKDSTFVITDVLGAMPSTLRARLRRGETRPYVWEGENRYVAVPVGQLDATGRPSVAREAGEPGTLTVDDFAFVGIMRVPLAAPSAGALAGHYVNGELRLILCQLGNKAVEFTVPSDLTQTWDTAPRATQTRSTWLTPGASAYKVIQRSPYNASVLVTPGATGATSTTCKTSGGFWHDGAMYVTYFDLYNTTNIPDPSLLRIEFADDGVSTSYGPWRIGTVKRNNQYFIPLPADVSAACGGATWANGSVGIQSGNASCSWGPSLFAFDGALPTASTAAYPDAAGIIASSYTLADFNYEHPSPRPADNIGEPVHGSTAGFWTQIDCSQSGTACWIETATKRGWWIGGHLGGGCVWYSGDDNHDGKITCDERDTVPAGHYVYDDTPNWVTGPHAGYYYSYWWIFSPADLISVATGAVTNGWDITASSEGLPPGGYYLTRHQQKVSASWFDISTGRLYVVSSGFERPVQSPYAYLPVINVYQVS